MNSNMDIQDIVIPKEKLKEVIETNLMKTVDDLLEKSYDNPIKDAVKECFEESSGVVKQLIREVIVEGIKSPEFKARLGEAVISHLVEKRFKQ